MNKITLLIVLLAGCKSEAAPIIDVPQVPDVVVETADSPPPLPDVARPFLPTPDPISTPTASPTLPAPQKSQRARSCPGGVCGVPRSTAVAPRHAPMRRFRFFRR